MKVCATLAITAVAAFAGSAKENEDDRGKAHEQESYTIGLFGDGPCADSLYHSALNYFNSLERPLILTPGDND